jgi:UDP-N-acetylenolpyruvoylglucosamine reductase
MAEPDAAATGEVPPGVDRDYRLDRLTTIRTGGPADFFARPDGEEELLELLAWAQSRGLAVGVVGSGSNLLVADDGFRGLAIKLDGELAAIERDGERILCGGGARLPSAAAKAAGWGLSGLEFGINIPGTAGGAVKMNANSYGGELGKVLEWVEVCTPAGGSQRRAPRQLGFSYRRSNLGPDEIVSRASFRLRAGEPAAIKQTLATMRSQRREAQPSGIKTFGSTFKNPSDEVEGRTAGQLLEAAGCRGLSRGGARFSEKHANFVENTGTATTADVLGLMAEGRRRVHERFGVELEPEVQVLGEVEWPEGWRLT